MSKQSTYIDVGCHNAKTKNPLFNKIKQEDYVLYVEPNPYLKDDIIKNTKSSNFHYEQCAVSDWQGRGEFYFDKRGFLSRKKGEKKDLHKGMRGGLETEDPYLSSFFSEECITVDVDTLDRILEEHNCPQHIDILKVDTEGQDYKILKHFFEYNYYFKVDMIITEDYYKTLTDKYELLQANGYKIIKRDNSDSTWIKK